jgi:AraC-like DNA-binding protein
MGWRTFVQATGGSGIVDRVRVRERIEISVVNCTLAEADRRAYEIDEPIMIMYASLASNLAIWTKGHPPIELNRPELTIVTVPKGLDITVEVQGGVRQQRLYGRFRKGALATALGLDNESLPPVLRETRSGPAAFGRVVSIPLEPKIASVVADTIDTPLDGEMRALQYEGRFLELVAYAIDALGRSESTGGLKTEQEQKIAQQARAMLATQYARPPDVSGIARRLGTNPNKLRAAFRNAFGITMADYCLDRRMREAQQLLLQPSLSVAQVGERVGYEYPSGFAAAFSRHVGLSPRDYRKHRAPISVELKTRDKDDR